MRRPAVSPHDPRLVVVGCDMTGSYITLDGGLSWRMFHLAGVVSAFVFDPVDPAVIYAVNSGLWRSDDRGRRWTLVWPDPSRNTVHRAWSDHGDTVYTTDDSTYPSGRDVDVQALAVDPADNRRLVLAVTSAPPGPPGSQPRAATQLLISTDRGRTWAARATLADEQVFVLAFEPHERLRAVAEKGVYELAWARTTDAPFRRAEPPGGPIRSASQGRANGRAFLYVTTPATRDRDAVVGGISVSEDGGRTWQASNGALDDGLRATAGGEDWGPAHRSRPSLGPVAASAENGLVAYLGLRGLRRPQGAANGIARTTDGGRTWTIVHEEADRPSANLEPSWIEGRAAEDGQSVWFDAPYDLAASPTNPEVAYATDLFRTYRTTDGGRSWAQVNSVRRDDDRWASRGLDVTTTYGVHFDPFDVTRLLVSWTDIGLFRSDDGGATWTGSSAGVPKEWRNTGYWVEFDPEVRGLVWGAFSGTHDLPRPKMWRRSDPAGYRGGVAVSRDGGRTWTPLPASGGFPESAVTHLLLDPQSAPGKRRIWATAFGRGVFRSDDDGRTWARKSEGIEGEQPFAWRLHRTSDATLYVVVARRSERGRIGDADDGALYRSIDGGDRWTKLTLPAGTNGPNGLTSDPRDSQRLYLAAWGVATPGGDTGGGLFVSTDAGTTWRNLLPKVQHVYDVTLDPRNADVVYVCGFDRGAWRSADRGQTWTRLRGYNFQWGQRVVPDRADPSRVYITTFGGSLWRGPAVGDPNAPEDVVAWDGWRPGP
jgi:photosystem II stability/assembly factor-like uncharacterized protein